MEAAIRFSRNSAPGNEDQRFLRVDVTGKSFSLCQITESKRNTIKYEIIHASTKVPPFRAFDWHPVNESMIAVGQSGGEATLLNIAEGYQDSTSFSVRSQRACNAVALSSENLIAVGLDKVRTDVCLNIWDINQRLQPGGGRSFSKGNTEPFLKLAGGELISSLKFLTQDPRLLVAGVKGQFVRLYDLREPNSSNGLQFATRCVNNIAIDPLDENYFASCSPTNEPLVSVWDRRMASRNGALPVTFSGVAQSEAIQPEVSLELKNVVDAPGAIWSLRFSKSRRGCLGIMSNNGQLKACDFASDYEHQSDGERHGGQSKQPWYESDPREIYLDSARDIERSLPPDATAKEQKNRVISFDFTTSNTKYGEPRVMVLTGAGELRMTHLHPPPEPASVSSTGFFCKGSDFVAGPLLDSGSDNLAKGIDRIRRAAEPRNALKQAFKQTKQSKTSSSGQNTDLRRMSSFANQCWNGDLGFFEKGVALEDLLRLISIGRLRCESGYLLSTTKNKLVASDSQWLESFWSWLEWAERISREGGMVQNYVDLSYTGVFGIWMEEIATKARSVGGNSAGLSAAIRNLAQRLNIPVRKLCQTEFRAHRQLCLYISGLAWSHEELESIVKRLVGGNQHTKAAAIALFTGDDRLAYQALRSKSSAQTHKMLAMALAGSKQRRKTSASSSATEDSNTEDDDEWTETIASLSSDLTDPYARAILAYVKSGDWSDVLDIDAVPLKYRIGVAVRHLEDNDLTAYVGSITRQVIEAGDVEGIVLTGTGTTEGLGLLSSYARNFNDLQTAILGLSVGGAAQRFVVNRDDEDAKANRTMEAFRETYRSQIMRWNRKFDRVRFDVTSSKARAQSPQHKLPRPKEQVRLVCTFCSGSLTQFPSNGISSNVVTPGNPPSSSSMRTMDTIKHPLTAEKAAVTGTVCPKCGRHLPRCGVCDHWLGTPDESYAKWHSSQPQHDRKASALAKSAGSKSKHTSFDMSASMSGSVATMVGPMTESSATIKPGVGEGHDVDTEEQDDQVEIARRAEERWNTALQKFTVFCITCGHGFHAAHARLWFEGKHGQVGHHICPVPTCDCRCNG